MEGVKAESFYSSEIAPTGHTPAQEPQLMQVSGSISYLPSPSLIAPTGHPPAQVPHDTQLSLITKAIFLYLLLLFLAGLTPVVFHCSNSNTGRQVSGIKSLLALKNSCWLLFPLLKLRAALTHAVQDHLFLFYCFSLGHGRYALKPVLYAEFFILGYTHRMVRQHIQRL